MDRLIYPKMLHQNADALTILYLRRIRVVCTLASLADKQDLNFCTTCTTLYLLPNHVFFLLKQPRYRLVYTSKKNILTSISKGDNKMNWIPAKSPLLSVNLYSCYNISQGVSAHVNKNRIFLPQVPFDKVFREERGIQTPEAPSFSNVKGKFPRNVTWY